MQAGRDHVRPVFAFGMAQAVTGAVTGSLGVAPKNNIVGAGLRPAPTGKNKKKNKGMIAP